MTRKRKAAQGADAAVNNKVIRMLTLLGHLPRTPHKVTTPRLHALLQEGGHAVDIRTVERYMLELCESPLFRGSILADTRGKPYAWSISRDLELLQLPMDPTTAALWDLVGRYVQHLLPRSAQTKVAPLIEQAQRWLSQHKVSGTTPWPKKVAYVPRGQPLQPAQIAPAVLEAVFEALHSGQQLEVRYNDTTESMVLHPRALVDRGVVTYLVASAWDYEDFRLYALHRIRRAQIMQMPIKRLTFSLDEFLQSKVMELPHGPEIKLKLRFYNGAGRHLLETPLNNSQTYKVEVDGVAQVGATLRDTDELRWWIQGFGANVEVLAPKALRREIGEALAMAVSRYA